MVCHCIHKLSLSLSLSLSLCLAMLLKVGFANSYGIDLELDFQSTGHQQETQAMMDWLEDRPFLISMHLRGQDENIVLPKDGIQQK